jgi:hypothetical protein
MAGARFVVTCVLTVVALSVFAVPIQAEVKGKCVRFCGDGGRKNNTRPARRHVSPPRRTNRVAAQRKLSKQLGDTGLRYIRRAVREESPALLKVALDYFRRAYVLWRHPNNRNNYFGGAAWYWNQVGQAAEKRRNYSLAARRYRTSLKYWASPNNRRISRRNLARVERILGRRTYPRVRVGRKKRGRTCGVCGRALRSDIRVRMGNPRRLRTYVTQSRAKYANCIRRIQGGCRTSTPYYIYLNALPGCYRFGAGQAFAACVRSAIR